MLNDLDFNAVAAFTAIDRRNLRSFPQ